MGLSWSRKHLQALGLKDGFVVIDGAPLRQVVGLADEVQQKLLIASQLCLTTLQISASFQQFLRWRTLWNAHFVLYNHTSWVLLTVRAI